MRKCRYTLAGLSDKAALTEPTRLLSELEKHQAGVPSYAAFCMAVSRPDRGTLTVSFFEDNHDYLAHYTKNVVFRRKPDGRIFCFSRHPGGQVWLRASPPTLIGLSLETRLRD